MVSFNGAAGSTNWTKVVYDEDTHSVQATQFDGLALPEAGDDVEISGFDVTLSALQYDGMPGIVAGAGVLTIGADASLTQTASGFRVTEGLDIDGEMTVSEAYLHLGGPGAEVTLTGSGELMLDNGFVTGHGGASSTTQFHNQGTITGSGIIGARFGVSGYPDDGGYLVIHNAADGVIEANISGETLMLHTGMSDADPIDNQGILRASNGGTLKVAGSYDQDGYKTWLVQSSGGRLEAVGGGTVLLDNAYVTGGILHSDTGGIIRTEGFYTRLIDLGLTATARVDVTSLTRLEGTIDNEGEIFISNPGATLDIVGDVTLTGGGSIRLTGGTSYHGIGGDGSDVVLTNNGNTIHGLGRIVNLELVNGAGGKVIADVSGSEKLLVDTGRTVTNNGVMRAEDGGTLEIRDKVVGSGTLEVTGGSTLVVSDKVDFDVTFVGNSHDTVELTSANISVVFDLDVSGMGVGDRIVIPSNYATSDLTFRVEDTADGVRIQGWHRDFGGTPWINLKGDYSEGQFELKKGDDYYFERVATHDGTGGSDTLAAAAGGERLIGLGGNDTLVSGTGNDLLDGSRGKDAADYRKATGGVTVSLAVSGEQAVGGGLGKDRLLGIENLNGSAYNDKLTGNYGNNVINGGAGNDALRGGGGTDTLTGGNGADTFAVSGYDNFAVAVTDFTLGTDKIGTENMPAVQSLADIAALVKNKANTTNAVLKFGNGQTLTLSGVDWHKLAVSDFTRIGNTAPSVSGYANTVEENSSIGTTVAAVLYVADEQNDRLTIKLGGDDGAFFTIDKDGNIRFKAKPDFDAKADKNHDNVYSFKAIVSDGHLSNALDLNVALTDVNEAPVITGPAMTTLSVKENTKGVFHKIVATDPEKGNLTYAFESQDGFLFFNIDKKGNLSFRTPPDFENPGDQNGDNIYVVKVRVSDGTFSDLQTLNIKVTDVLGITKNGTAKAETLLGTGEQDKLNGKGGSDKLIGGASADTFIFDTKLGAGNIDQIDDFDVRQDKIWLDDDVFTKVGKVGHLAASAFWTGTTAHDKDDRIVYDQNTGKLFYDGDGKGGAAAVHFATLHMGLALTAGHFDIIG